MWYGYREVVERLVEEAGVSGAERAAYCGFCLELYASAGRAEPGGAEGAMRRVVETWLGRGLELGRMRRLAMAVMDAATGRGMEVHYG